MSSFRANRLLPVCFIYLIVRNVAGSVLRHTGVSEGSSLHHEDTSDEQLAGVSPSAESAKLLGLRRAESSDRRRQLGLSRKLRLLEEKDDSPTVTTRHLDETANETYCGCLNCTNTFWNLPAPADAGSDFSCGNRIRWMISQGTPEGTACRSVGEAFPDICGACNPNQCTLKYDNYNLTSPAELYCFRPSSQRKRWRGVWNGEFDVEVKSSDTACGPSSNLFSDDAVSLTNNELTLQFKKVNDSWVGSEVRVILPQERQPFSYGTFKFSIKNVSMIDLTTGQAFQKYLPPDMVIGMYTWNPSEDPTIHENYNHEVDIEISKWGVSTALDGQFLIQPPGFPQFFRFNTGTKKKPSPGGKTYEVTWRPTSMFWKTSAHGGISYSYTTQMALNAGVEDRIQCLPTALEMRLNLWNMKGVNQPSSMSDNQMAEVVIDNFSYTPSYILGVANGEVCSKDCQCLPSSRCINNRCAKQII